MGKKMAAVKKCDVPVVDEDYLDKAASGAALLKIPGSTISDWGAPRHSVSQDSTVGSSKEEKRFKSQGQERRRVACEYLQEHFFKVFIYMQYKWHAEHPP